MMTSLFLPRRSTVRYTDLGEFASNPYSSRMTPFTNSLSNLLTDRPVISTEFATSAILHRYGIALETLQPTEERNQSRLPEHGIRKHLVARGHRQIVVRLVSLREACFFYRPLSHFLAKPRQADTATLKDADPMMMTAFRPCLGLTTEKDRRAS
jgi:hypothetical protein